jgi:methyl-accepting chemotaxis protein
MYSGKVEDDLILSEVDEGLGKVEKSTQKVEDINKKIEETNEQFERISKVIDVAATSLNLLIKIASATSAGII